ncbi:MAG: adenosylmethionine decarboxylase [Oscillochloris sp.]|nr:adenosylmethionine decarboxylase [Oscillochloris sp.]
MNILPDPSQDYGAHGRHLLLTLTGCPAQLLDDLTGLENLVRRAAAATGATVLEVMSHQFAPQGVTALALLAESHASLHTYPERGLAFWDCFTCGMSCDPARSIAVLSQALQATSVQQQEIQRQAE